VHHINNAFVTNTQKIYTATNSHKLLHKGNSKPLESEITI